NAGPRPRVAPDLSRLRRVRTDAVGDDRSTQAASADAARNVHGAAGRPTLNAEPHAESSSTPMRWPAMRDRDDVPEARAPGYLGYLAIVFGAVLAFAWIAQDV